MALAKPYKATAGQAADLDLMLDELYQSIQDLETRLIALTASTGPMGPRGFTGMRGADGEQGPRGRVGNLNMANPAATIGLTAVNGIATTALRSDGAPALSQAIVPTWTGVHTFSAKLTANGTIEFPAVQVAAAGANDLDDYEEGSWTPVIGGSGGTTGQTYAIQVGRYIKIGKVVCAIMNVALVGKGTISGSVEIQGLPFTSDNVTSLNPTSTVLQFSGLATTWVHIFALILVNTTVARLRGNTAAATNNTTELVTADLNVADAGFVGGFVYQASA